MIAIVADSTVCATRDQARAMGLTVVPTGFTAGAQAYTERFMDDRGPEETRELTLQPDCKTSHAPVSAFQQAFEGLLAQGFDVLCLTISSRLSGAYSSASVAARETDEGRIAVVDSQTTCGGLWLLCKAARGLADEGLGLSDLALRVKELRPKAGIVFSVENMDALRRSGRLGVIPQSVGTLLNIRPILQCQNGSVASVGVARGLQDRVRQILRRIPEKPVALMLHYLLPAPTADALRQAIEQKFEGVPLYTAIGGPVLGIHLGAGTIGVSWITE